MEKKSTAFTSWSRAVEERSHKPAARLSHPSGNRYLVHPKSQGEQVRKEMVGHCRQHLWWPWMLDQITWVGRDDPLKKVMMH